MGVKLHVNVLQAIRSLVLLEPWICEIYVEVARVEAGQVGRDKK